MGGSVKCQSSKMVGMRGLREITRGDRNFASVLGHGKLPEQRKNTLSESKPTFTNIIIAHNDKKSILNSELVR